MRETLSFNLRLSGSFLFVCLFVWFLNIVVNYYVISVTGPETEHLTILRAATHETALGDHDSVSAGHVVWETYLPETLKSFHPTDPTLNLKLFKRERDTFR